MRITWNNGTKCLGRCLGHSKPLVNIGFLPLYHSKISLIYISRMDGLGYCKLLSGCQFAPSIVSHISFLELSWQIMRNLLAKIEALALLVPIPFLYVWASEADFQWECNSKAHSATIPLHLSETIICARNPHRSVWPYTSHLTSLCFNLLICNLKG